MQTQDLSPSASFLPLSETLKQRRHHLATLIDAPVILWSGRSSARNFPANAYPFRTSSHFLYFAGLPLENAAIRLEQGRLELFVDDPRPADILWHGVTPTRDEIAAEIGADAAFPLIALMSRTTGAATLSVQDPATRQQQPRLLDRPVASAHQAQGLDGALAKAIARMRLCHDVAGLAEIRAAATVTVQAHIAGMAATRTAHREAQIRAAMEGVIMAHNMTTAYSSIVTVHGEVLHNSHYHHALQPGDLLLADVGAEATSGWASDVTRTWPVSGKFSSTQRDLYDVVLTAHDRCIDQLRPGIEYQDVHLVAAHTLAEGLVSLGILRGQPDELVARDAHALFFPHGIGHLLGLDVHDMEDLGDLAGYEDGRIRSDRFGLCYLRLNRTLRPGMVVTIEPGFYQVPALLNDPERRATYQDCVNWEQLAKFSDVRGIRIEDDVLITATGYEVLTAALPTHAEAIEALTKS